MRKVRLAWLALMVLMVVPHSLAAQDSPKPEAKKPETLLKVQVTFTENQGEKKLANLPYTFFLKTADASSLPPSWTKVRIGSRVPVYAGKDGGIQYVDIGTNIDSRALPSDSGRFDIFVNLERSWVEGEVPVAAGGPVDQNASCKQPIIRQFKTELSLTMHDGETIQTTQAADPLSGRILTISVTMNVVK